MIQGLNNIFYRISPCNIGTQFQRHMFTIILVPSEKQVFAPNTLKIDRTIDLSKKKMRNLHQSKGLWAKFIRDFYFRHWTYITTLKTTKAFNGEAAANAYFKGLFYFYFGRVKELEE